MMLTIDDTQEIVARVVKQVKAAVVATMGPNGKLAFIANGTAVKVTKDGVTVAKSIRFEDPREELVNRVITEPAIKTDHECGDGTTTTVLYTALLYELFVKHPSFREQKFIEDCVRAVILELGKMAISIGVDDPRLELLALTSSNNDEELAKVITDIYRSAGDRFPEIELKDGQAATDKVVRSNGLPIQMYFSNPAFAKGGNGADTDFTDFYPLIIDSPVGRGGDTTDILLDLNDAYSGKTVIVIARSIEHETVQQMARLNNNTRLRKEKVAATPDLLQGVPVGAHFIGLNTNAGGSVGTLIMQDIATMFGAPTFTQLDDAVGAQIPLVTSVLTVNTGRSILNNISSETTQLLNKRADDIGKELGGMELGDRFSQRAKFNETRIRNLRGELVTIFVGGETYSDVIERKDRFEDVVKAIKSALVNGILPGVGSSLVIAGQRALGKIYNTPFTRKEIDQETIDRVSMIRGLATICAASYNHLMSQISDASHPVQLKELDFIGEVVPPQCTNLATGETGTSEELGIYDTAFATITALKGGLQTAKILANGSSILLGDKLSAVAMKR